VRHGRQEDGSDLRQNFSLTGQSSMALFASKFDRQTAEGASARANAHVTAGDGVDLTSAPRRMASVQIERRFGACQRAG
jgi:hypothetical protein